MAHPPHVRRQTRLPDARGYRTFRQVGFGGSFEGYTTVGLGVRARLPFRVLTVGTDVVVDVATAGERRYSGSFRLCGETNRKMTI